MDLRCTGLARKPSEAFAAAAGALTGGGALHFEPFDLTDIAAILAFVQAPCASDAGPIYGLINNAGMGGEGLLATMSNGDIEGLLRLNTLGQADRSH